MADKTVVTLTGDGRGGRSGFAAVPGNRAGPFPGTVRMTAGPLNALACFTIDGAFLTYDEDLRGSIEVGKEADFVLFDATLPEWQPLYNPVSNLVYSATGNTVKHVFVGGEQVVRDGRLTRIDYEELLGEVAKACQRITGRLDMKKLTKLRWPVE